VRGLRVAHASIGTWELRAPEPGWPFDLHHDGRRHLHSVDWIRARDVATFLPVRGFTG